MCTILNFSFYFICVSSGVVEWQPCCFLGAGLFAKSYIPEGAFLLEYKGDILTYAEGERRLDSNSEGPSFMFFLDDIW